MRKILYLLSLPLLMLVSCSEPAVDTFGNIAGTVTEGKDLIPMAGVSVKISPLGYSQVTGNDGAFQFDNLEVQEYTLSFSKVGYEPHEEKVSVKPGVSSSIQITMKQAVTSVPTLYVTNPTNITKTSVKLHAMLSSIGNSQVTQHGFCYGKNHNPTTSDQTVPLGMTTTTGPFSADVIGLEQNTTYYFRAFATNNAGTAYSEEMTFATLDENSGGTQGGIAVSSGLKAYYTFDEGDCRDATEFELDGLPFNSPTYTEDTPSGFGKAAFVNGNKQQYFSINYELFKGLKNYSIAMWLKDFSTGTIISGVTSDNNMNAQWPRLTMQNDGTILFWTKGDSYRDNPPFGYNYSRTGIQSSEWHHIAVTCSTNDDSDCVLCLYVDGVLQDNVTSYWRNSRELKVQIGGNGNNTFSTYASMKIDNVRIYGRTISADDVKDIYNAEK